LHILCTIVVTSPFMNCPWVFFFMWVQNQIYVLIDVLNLIISHRWIYKYTGISRFRAMAMFDALHLYLFFFFIIIINSQTPCICVGSSAKGYILNYLDVFIIMMFYLHSNFYSMLTNEQLSAWLCNCRSYIEADSASWSGGAFVFWNNS
jgi:hypothetical protein